MEGKTKNNNKLYTVVALIMVAIVAGFGVWFFNYSSKDAEDATDQQVAQQQAQATISEDGNTVAYNGVEGQSALSLLKQYTDVKTDEFVGIGEYVVGINGVEADSTTNFWAFYVNGEQAQVGAGDYITKNNEQIEWRLEDVEAFEE